MLTYAIDAIAVLLLTLLILVNGLIDRHRVSLVTPVRDPVPVHALAVVPSPAADIALAAFIPNSNEFDHLSPQCS